MGQPNFSVQFFANTAVAGGASVGMGLVDSGTSGLYNTSTSANRSGGKRTSWLVVALGHPLGAYIVQSSGDVDPSITGLAAGAASWVRMSATGTCERFTPVAAGTSDVIGWCEATGLLHLCMGVLTETSIVGGSGGSVPTGTGFRHITSGAEDAASAIVDVTNTAHVLVADLPPDVDLRCLLTGSSYRRSSATPANVDQWNCEKRSGIDFSNTVDGATQPTISATLANGHEAINSVSASSQRLDTGIATLGQLVGSVTGDYVGWLVFRASAVNGTSGDAAVYNNEALISDTGSQLWGVYLQNLTGTLNVCHYNWDSAARVAKSSFSASAWNVVQVRRTGGNIYLKVNSTAETAGVAVGSVAVSGTLSVMRGGSTTYMDGQVAFIGFATGGNIASDTGAGGRLERMRKALGARFGVTVT